MKTGIVILNFNTFFETIKCYESILAHECERYYFYIVDNNSSDGSQQMIKEYFNKKDVKLIFSDKNLGFSGGNNLGIKEAIYDQCDTIFLLNSDILLLNNAISKMVSCLYENEEYMIVGPSVYDCNNNYKQFARYPLNTKNFFKSGKVFSKLFPKNSKKSRFLDYDRDIDFSFDGMLSGCCFGFKTSIFDRKPLLDDNVFLYYEEDILAHKLVRAHKKAVICSKAKVVHLEGASYSKPSQDKLSFTRFYRWLSSLYVLRYYNQTSYFLCKIISYKNIIIWACMSLINKEYRKRLKAFIFENKKLFKRVII